MAVLRSDTHDGPTEDQLQWLLTLNSSKIRDSELFKPGFQSKALVNLLVDLCRQRIDLLTEVRSVLESENPRQFVFLLDFDVIHEYLAETDTGGLTGAGFPQSKFDEMTFAQYFFECTSWRYHVPSGTMVEVQEFMRKERLLEFFEAWREAEDPDDMDVESLIFSTGGGVVDRDGDYYRKIRMLHRYVRVFSPEHDRLRARLSKPSVCMDVLESIRRCRGESFGSRRVTDRNDQSDAENVQTLVNMYEDRRACDSRPMLVTQTGPVMKAVLDIANRKEISERLSCSVKVAVCMHELGASEDVIKAMTVCKSLTSLWGGLLETLWRFDIGRPGEDKRRQRNNRFLEFEVLRFFDQLSDDSEKRRLEETLVCMTGAAKVRGFLLDRSERDRGARRPLEKDLEDSRLVDLARSLMYEAPAPPTFASNLREVMAPTGSFSRHHVIELTHGVSPEPIINCSEFIPRLPGDKRRRFSFSWPVSCGLSRLRSGLLSTALLQSNGNGVCNGENGAIRLLDALPACAPCGMTAYLSFDQATVEVPVSLLGQSLSNLLSEVYARQRSESRNFYGWWRVGGDVGCLVIHAVGWEIRFELKPLDAHHRRVMFIKSDAAAGDVEIIATMYDWTGGRFIYRQSLLECLQKLF